MEEMPRKLAPLVCLAVPMAFVLYFYGLGSAGLIGPDEPRYASIGREMALSGDWVTPRLWGQPWFEKPPLLYWMTGAGFRLGLGTELAPRLPVALLSVAFLVFFWRILERQFGELAAWCGAFILGTCGLWIGFSYVGATDLPMAVMLSASMLLMLAWLRSKNPRLLIAAGALMGLAALAKGLLPLALAAPAAPFLWLASGPRQGGPSRARMAALGFAPFLLVALPWYILCYSRNGVPFLREFFWRQHFERFTSTVLQHTQPWWFYIPVFLAGFLPWTPLLFLAFRRTILKDRRRLFLLAWMLFGLVFLSASVNKLPGYVLALLPPAAALAGIALAEARKAAVGLSICAVFLAAFPVAVESLPAAVASGVSSAGLPQFRWTWLLPAVLAAAVWLLDRRSRRFAAVAAVSLGAAAGLAYVKHAALPLVDREATARPLWNRIAAQAPGICLEELHRNWTYGLNYYSVIPLPSCSAEPKPLRVRQVPGKPPFLAESDK